MIVPTQKGPSGLAPQQEMPSEANLLMALSEMQKHGRFQQVAANTGAIPQSIMDVAGGLAKGTHSAADMRNVIRMEGWQYGRGLRSKNQPIELYDPQGNQHLISNEDM